MLRNAGRIAEANALVDLGLHPDVPAGDPHAAAERLRGGWMTDYTGREFYVGWPFTMGHYEATPPQLKLSVASLAPAASLLSIYQDTGEPRHLRDAVRYAQSFILADEQLWLPEGLVWNDHAIAARTSLLSRLVFEVVQVPQDGADRPVDSLLASLSRHLRLLAADDHFTFWSNHGLMQSIAFMQASILVPTLPAVRANIADVIERTDRQLGYLISTSGIATEHSAQYQVFNLELLSQAIRLVKMIDGDCPDHWSTRFTRGVEFYQSIRRPDGTVPRYGDTSHSSIRVSPDELLGQLRGSLRPSGRRHRSSLGVRLDPHFGYWSEWNARSHLTAIWARFPSNVHKHADELSVHFWSDNQEWWTSSGYWPYTDRRRAEAVSWKGSNAPHVATEPTDSSRTSRVIGSFTSPSISVLHLERHSEAGYRVERQIVRAGSHWIVLDTPAEAAVMSESIWRVMPSVDIRELGDKGAQRFILETHTSSAKLFVQVLLGEGSSAGFIQGDDTSSESMTALAREPTETETLRLAVPGGGWSGLAWTPYDQKSGGFDRYPSYSILLESASNWHVGITDAAGQRVVSREAETVTVEHDDSRFTARLTSPKLDSSRLYEDALTTYHAMQENYRTFVSFMPWRTKVFRLALVASSAQVVLLWILWRQRVRFAGGLVPLLGLILVGHILIALWLHLFDFAPGPGSTAALVRSFVCLGFSGEA